MISRRCPLFLFLFSPLFPLSFSSDIFPLSFALFFSPFFVSLSASHSSPGRVSRLDDASTVGRFIDRSFCPVRSVDSKTYGISNFTRRIMSRLTSLMARLCPDAEVSSLSLPLFFERDAKRRERVSGLKMPEAQRRVKLDHLELRSWTRKNDPSH